MKWETWRDSIIKKGCTIWYIPFVVAYIQLKLFSVIRNCPACRYAAFACCPTCHARCLGEGTRYSYAFEPICGAISSRNIGSQTGHSAQFAAASEHVIIATLYQNSGFQLWGFGQALASIEHACIAILCPNRNSSRQLWGCSQTVAVSEHISIATRR